LKLVSKHIAVAIFSGVILLNFVSQEKDLFERSDIKSDVHDLLVTEEYRSPVNKLSVLLQNDLCYSVLDTYAQLTECLFSHPLLDKLKYSFRLSKISTGEILIDSPNLKI